MRREPSDKMRSGPGGKRPMRKRTNRPMTRPIRYQMPLETKVDYKNIALLQKYLTDRGKIVSRRASGISAKQQRELSQAIKRARFLGLLSVGPTSHR